MTHFELPSNTAVWAIDLDRFRSELDSNCLSTAERVRAERFSNIETGVRYRSAHIALRQLLAQTTGIPAQSLEFSLGTHGKPALLGRQDCFFNLSHSGARALVAISHGAEAPEIGVDIEGPRELDDLQDLLPAVFTEAERAEFQHVSPAQQATVFLQLWTRKEACLKAWGCGLQIAPNLLELGARIHSNAPAFFQYPPHRPLLVQTSVLGDGYFGSIALVTE